jgi:hypothetical protein
MDEMDFAEALSNVEDLINEYQQYQSITVNETIDVEETASET